MAASDVADANASAVWHQLGFSTTAITCMTALEPPCTRWQGHVYTAAATAETHAILRMLIRCCPTLLFAKRLCSALATDEQALVRVSCRCQAWVDSRFDAVSEERRRELFEMYKAMLAEEAEAAPQQHSMSKVCPCVPTP
jgi:hypothetical protein